MPNMPSNNRLLVYCGLLILCSANMALFCSYKLNASTSNTYSSRTVLSLLDTTTAATPPPPHPQETYKTKAQRMTKNRIERLKGPDGPKFTVLVTGAAGFVGMHTALALKEMGMTPIGYDNVNEYYSIQLKESRIQELKQHDVEFVRWALVL